jgi:hypothetical protein
MLAAVQFDDKPPVEANEVGHIRPYRVLAAEFESREPPVAQLSPYLSLGVG